MLLRLPLRIFASDVIWELTMGPESTFMESAGHNG